MSPDVIMGLILAALLVGGVLLISMGFAHGEHRRKRRANSGSGGAEAGFLAAPGVFDGGGSCSSGDGGGSCDGGGGGS
jgi:hypothetical protein